MKTCSCGESRTFLNSKYLGASAVYDKMVYWYECLNCGTSFVEKKKLKKAPVKEPDLPTLEGGT